MKNRLFTFLTLSSFFLTFSFNAFADITAVCLAVATTNGPIETVLAETLDGVSNNTVYAIESGKDLMINWVSPEDLGYVYIEYYNYTQGGDWIYIGPAYHNTEISLSANSYDWHVPPAISGDNVYVRIRPANNSGISASYACLVDSGTAKKENSFLDPTSIEISCFPNPVVNELKITTTNPNNTIQSIQIYDMNGNAVRSQYVDHSFIETINVADLPKGTYLAIINEEQFVKVVKN